MTNHPLRQRRPYEMQFELGGPAYAPTPIDGAGAFELVARLHQRGIPAYERDMGWAGCEERSPASTRRS
jgi:hypothetical protein